MNGQPVQAPVVKGFATVARKWKNGDRVEFDLPMAMRLEAIEASHQETVALVRGPLVLFALTENASDGDAGAIAGGAEDEGAGGVDGCSRGTGRCC